MVYVIFIIIIWMKKYETLLKIVKLSKFDIVDKLSIL